MIGEKDILKALSAIIDPDFKQDIVTLGFIKNLKINGTEVTLDIELTTPACPVKETFKSEAERLIGALEGVSAVTVNLTAQRRAPSGGSGESLLSKVGCLIAVASCKGGVGKSTVAALLATTLAERGYRVGLLDADIYGPSVPAMFKAETPIKTSENQQIVTPAVIGNLKIMSFGYLIGNEPAVLRGPIVSKYIQLMLHQVDWGELDYLFIDMPPGTGDIQLTITQQARLDGAIIVTTPQTLSLVDVARGILMFEKVEVPMLGIVANMSYFMCKGCTDKQYIFGNLPEKKLHERFGIPVLAELAVQPHLSMLNFHSKGKTYLNDDINKLVDNAVKSIGKSKKRHLNTPEIHFDDKSITLAWQNGETLSVEHRVLRLNSQDALSVNEMTGERILKPEDIRPDIKPLEVFPIGNYALSVKWNDGHTAGIYSYRLIREISSSISVS